jgi:hypothetical protein
MTSTTTTPAAIVTPEDRAAAIVASIPTPADYMAADRAGKAAIRTAVTAIVQAAIRPNGAGLAVAMTAQAALDAYAPAATSAPTVDYADRIAVRIATFRLAADLLESGAVMPTDLPDDVAIALGRGLITPDVAAACTMAADRIAPTKRRDLNALLVTATERLQADGHTGYQPVIVFRNTVAAIVAENGDTDGYRPSGGAVEDAFKAGVVGVHYAPSTGARRAGGIVTEPVL